MGSNPASAARSSWRFRTCRGEATTGERSSQATSQSTKRRPLEPGKTPEGGEVRLQVEVSVAALPARHRVARLGIHLHVEREQVVAALDPVLGGLVEEELGLLALAQQATLHVSESGHDRVDSARLDLRSKLIQRQHEADSNPDAAGLGWPML